MDSILYTLNLARMGQRPRKAIQEKYGSEGDGVDVECGPFRADILTAPVPGTLSPAIHSCHYPHFFGTKALNFLGKSPFLGSGGAGCL